MKIYNYPWASATTIGGTIDYVSIEPSNIEERA